jgi:hypothetical protein
MSTSWVGFAGTVIVIIAYMPQIIHLVKAQCSAGISLNAYGLWLIASFLLLAHAFNLNDPVFLALQSSTGRNHDDCGLRPEIQNFHLPGSPAAASRRIFLTESHI